MAALACPPTARCCPDRWCARLHGGQGLLRLHASPAKQQPSCNSRGDGLSAKAGSSGEARGWRAPAAEARALWRRGPALAVAVLARPRKRPHSCGMPCDERSDEAVRPRGLEQPVSSRAGRRPMGRGSRGQGQWLMREASQRELSRRLAADGDMIEPRGVVLLVRWDRKLRVLLHRQQLLAVQRGRLWLSAAVTRKQRDAASTDVDNDPRRGDVLGQPERERARGARRDRNRALRHVALRVRSTDVNNFSEIVQTSGY